MSQGNGIHVAGERRLLAERVASSSYLNRSARLRDLLLYLTERVMEDPSGEIHEQEVGHKVFGRTADYDTSSDNIVRVHASMLRKRLDQYFSTEGASEPTVIEIPKGNYAPVFRDRSVAPGLVATAVVPTASRDGRSTPKGRAASATLLVLVVLFAASTVFLLLRQPSASDAGRPTVRLLWSQIFRPGRSTDVVLDDAAVTLYQELTGRSLSLSEYFDRSYQRNLPDTDVGAIALKRQASFASVIFCEMIADFARAQPDGQDLKSNYLVTLRMIERLHRLLLDLIKDEFERVGRTDVNSVQALLLFNIGDVELTAGELKTRGLYLGSNVSYNLKKLVESGYIHHQRSRTDKRSVRVKLTDKGKAISEMVNRLLERQLTMLEKVGGVTVPDLKHFNQISVKLERFWGDQIRYQL